MELTFTVEIRPSRIHEGKTVVHVKPWPYDKDVARWAEYDSREIAVQEAPEVFASALIDAEERARN